MDKKICCFSGHSRIYDSEELFKNILKKAEELIVECGVSEFWVGNYGDSDRIFASAIRKLKEKYHDIKLILVLPYLTATINENKELYYKNFDCMLMADIPENTPKRFYISKCNQYMINNSDYMICYVKYGWGGAAKTLDIAKRQQNIKIINIAEP